MCEIPSTGRTGRMIESTLRASSIASGSFGEGRVETLLVVRIRVLDELVDPDGVVECEIAVRRRALAHEVEEFATRCCKTPG